MTYWTAIPATSAAPMRQEFLEDYSKNPYQGLKKSYGWLVKTYIPDVQRVIRDDPFMVLAVPFFIGIAPFLAAITCTYHAVRPFLKDEVNVYRALLLDNNQ